MEQFLGLKNASQKFILPLSECRESFFQTLEDLQQDPWAVPAKHRPFRATGLAVSVGASMLHSLHAGLAAQRRSPSGKLVLLAAGPCTCGPGQIVDADMT